MADPHSTVERDLLLRQQADATYRANFEQAAVGMAQLDLHANVLRANQALCDVLGYTQEELIGLAFESITHPDDLADSRAVRSQMTSGATGARRIEKRYLRKDGSIMWAGVHSAVVNDERGNPAYFLATIEDITQLKSHEQRVASLNRVYSVLSGVNQVLVHVREPQAMFDEACRIIVEVGGFAMARVGLVEPDSVHVRSVAASSAGGAYLGAFHLELGSEPASTGPVALAISKHRREVVQDIEREVAPTPWRTNALAVGHRSAAAFPLLCSGRVIGALNIAATEPGFFDAEQVELLDELAGDMSFALGIAEEQEQRRRAEERLSVSETKYRTAFRTSPDAVNLNRLSDGLFLEVNQGFTELTEYTEHDVAGKTSLDISIWADELDRDQLVAGLRADGVVNNLEAQFRRKDGSLTTALMSARLIEVAGEPCILSITRDISARITAEAALRESEGRMQAMFSEAPLGFQSLDAEGLFIDVNPAWLSTLGYERDEVIGQWFGKFLAPEYVEAFRERFELFKSLGAIHSEFEMMHKDGSRRAVAFEGRIGVNTDGSFRQTYCILSDMTERKAAADALAREQTLYKATFDHAAIGIAQVTPQGRWLNVNKTLCDILGYSPEEFEHLSFADITHPDDVERTVGALKSMNGDAQDSYRTEKRYVRKDGATIWVDVSVAAIREEDGSLAYQITAVQDITDRKRAEEDLRKSELRYRTIADGASDVVWILDPQTSRFTYVSPSVERQMGFTPDEVLAGQMEALLSPQSASVVHETLAQAMEDFLSGTVPEGQPYEIQAELVRKDAPPMWAEIVASMVGNEETGLLEVHGVTRDITERKVAEGRLAKAFSSLIDVVGRVTETRDPYTAGHQRRVAELSVAIATQMGMPEIEIEEIRNAALVHDIGKMSVPAEILSKPGALLPIEFGLIKGHAKAGYDILEASDMPGQLPEIVYQHHERCDGSGYPRGLCGDELLPEAKVIMVADVVEAMMSHRPYRPGLGVDAALDEIETGAGTKYSLDVAEACLELFRDGFTFADV